jgi:hypothetical protein
LSSPRDWSELTWRPGRRHSGKYSIHLSAGQRDCGISCGRDDWDVRRGAGQSPRLLCSDYSQRMGTPFPFQLASVFSQMLKESLPLHGMVIVSCLASEGMPRRASSLRSSRIREIASARLVMHTPLRTTIRIELIQIIFPLICDFLLDNRTKDVILCNK